MLLMDSEKKVLFLALQVILGNQRTLAHAMQPLLQRTLAHAMQPVLGSEITKLLGDMQGTTEKTMEMVDTVVKSLR